MPVDVPGAEMQAQSLPPGYEATSGQGLQAPYPAPLPKRRRVSLACTSCRDRKSRCDGERPHCTPCLDHGLNCVYEAIAQENRVKRRVPQKNGQIHRIVVGTVRQEDSEQARLRERVRELEARLNSVPTAALEAPLSERISEQPNDGPRAIALTDKEAGLHHGRASSPIVAPRVTPAADAEPPIDEVTVDTLATVAFNEVPEGSERDIGFFGPSSNHALFRTLSIVFAHVAHLFSPRQNPVRNPEQSPDAFSRPHSSPSARDRSQNSSGNESDATDAYSLPRDNLTFLINQFFATVGMVLPYVTKLTLLSECNRAEREKNRRPSRPMRSLLNIICAHASSTLGNRNAQAYYHRALALLDEQTLRGSSLELIQALLLISSFQQNNQRSVASWTLHAIAVKAAFQLGLHSPTSYKDHALHDSELRKRLWYAVVNQDKYLCTALGRPCLIPPQHIRVEKPQDSSSILHTTPVITPDYTDSLLYFNHLISLHTINGSIVDSLYDYNIESSDSIPLQELIIRRAQLLWKLEQWREDVSSFCRILSDAEICQWSTPSYATKRFQVLLSIQYYSATLLINRPVLTRFLSENVKERHSGRAISLLLETMIPLIKRDFSAAKELTTIIHSATTYGGTFLDCNAAWWVCNYTIFTVNLHLFGILLACKGHNATLFAGGITIGDVRSSLDYGLKTLKAVERTSLMSRKAGHCLKGFLKIFDSLTSDQLPTDASFHDMQVEESTAMPSLGFSQDIMPENFFSQYVAQSADDFLFQCSDNTFLDADLDFLHSL